MAHPDRIRNVCFTINNPIESDYADLANLEVECDYLIYSKEHFNQETHPNTTPHLQGYLELHNQQRFNTFRKKLPRAHLEMRRGTSLQASGYCKEEDGAEVYEYGTLSAPGKKGGLDDIVAMVTSGMSKRKMAEENPMAVFKHHRGIDALRDALSKPYDSSIEREVYVYWGPTGTGKTRKALEENPGAYKWGPANKTWFHKYDGEKTVILDEFRGQIPFGMLLQLLDRYPMKVETKGSMVEFVPTKIIITSPYPPDQWYTSDEFNKFERKEQLLRRLKGIYRFGDDPNPI